MNTERIREFCLSMPHATEDIQWGNDLLFRVAGKIFAVICLDEAQPHRFTVKCTPEEFEQLTEREGIVPAPYTARYHWIAVVDLDALSQRDAERLVEGSYGMVVAKLPKRVVAGLESNAATSSRAKKPR